MENKDWREQLPKLVIDLVWSATDGGCKITESNFSHFGEPIPEWTALVSKFSESITQAIAEERVRVEKEIREGIIWQINGDKERKYFDEKLTSLFSPKTLTLKNKDE